jgi:hypothetical protein
MRKFKCEACEKVFPIPDNYTDEMAREEFTRLYPGESFDRDKVAKVCDECHNLIEMMRRADGDVKRTLQ